MVRKTVLPEDRAAELPDPVLTPAELEHQGRVILEHLVLAAKVAAVVELALLEVLHRPAQVVMAPLGQMEQHTLVAVAAERQISLEVMEVLVVAEGVGNLGVLREQLTLAVAAAGLIILLRARLAVLELSFFVMRAHSAGRAAPLRLPGDIHITHSQHPGRTQHEQLCTN